MIKNKLSIIMASRGISNKELASKTGIYETSISKIKNGQRNLDLKKWILVAKVLSCTLDDLIDVEECMKEESECQKN